MLLVDPRPPAAPAGTDPFFPLAMDQGCMRAADLTTTGRTTPPLVTLHLLPAAKKDNQDGKSLVEDPRFSPSSVFVVDVLPPLLVVVGRDRVISVFVVILISSRSRKRSAKYFRGRFSGSHVRRLSIPGTQDWDQGSHCDRPQLWLSLWQDRRSSDDG